MIKHIVFFKVVNQPNKEEAIEFVINTLKPLADQIPQVKFYELGKNFSTRETAFDIALLSHFDTKEDLEAYRNHPLHKQAVEKIKPYVIQTAVVDYEIN